MEAGSSALDASKPGSKARGCGFGRSPDAWSRLRRQSWVRLLQLVTLFLFRSLLEAQTNYRDQFWVYMKNKDYANAELFLKKWEELEKNSIEVYIAYFNYFIFRDMKQIVVMGTMPDGRQGLYPKDVYNIKINGFGLIINQ